MNNEHKLGRGGKLGNLKGQAGVYAVASQLCLLGHVPFFPAVDHGVDLVMANGIRLQVKIACLTYPKSGMRKNGTGGNYLGGAYGFNLRRGVWDRSNNRWKRNESGTYHGVADFFVLWGIDENRFWIVPTSVKNRVIWFGRAEHPNGSNNAPYTNAIKQKRSLDYETRWDLLDVNAVVSDLTVTVPAPGSYQFEATLAKEK